MSGIPLRSADNGTAGLVGTAFFLDDGGAQVTLSAQHETDGSAQLIGPHFVSGFDGRGQWESSLKIMNVGGTGSVLSLELVDTAGSRLYVQDVSLAPDGQAQLVLSSLLPADRFTSGYILVRSDSGRAIGTVAISWQQGETVSWSSYPLAEQRSRTFHFNHVAQGNAGGIEYWTGIALANPTDRRVTVTVEAYGSAGAAGHGDSTAVSGHPGISTPAGLPGDPCLRSHQQSGPIRRQGKPHPLHHPRHL